MKRLTILATLLFAAVSVSAQDYHIKLWDNTTAPTSNGVTGDEYERKPGTLTNTSSAEIWIYKPAPEKATGQAIVFCPGGGYSQLSIANGHNTCKWFAENGIVGVMLKYRLPNGHSEVPLDDLDKAVATVREMAGELGVNVQLARRAGLLHDIGKALDHEIEGSHVQIGVDICKKYRENPQVIHAIEAHHGDVEPKTTLAFIIMAADAISAARPGARRENMESYIKRLETLEALCNGFEGVESSYAVQAGREVRILVQPDKVGDDEVILLARNVAKKIENELDYPGQIKVNMVRETRAIDYAK